MGDEQHREAEAGLELADLFDDVALHHYIERGGGLIHDDQPGLEGQRHGDADALAHATGELMWIVIEAARTDADQLEQFGGPGESLGAAGPGAMRENGVLDLLGHLDHRVQGIHRRLEDEADLAPAVAAQPLGGKAQHILTHEADGAAGNEAGQAREAGERKGDSGFAAAALPGEPEGFAGADVEVDAVDGTRHGVGADIVDGEVTDLDQGCVRQNPHSGCGGGGSGGSGRCGGWRRAAGW